MKLRIIISDTDKNFIKILDNFISINPQLQHLYTCNNGLEVINQLYKKQGDLYIIDLYTPIMTGLEAIKIIRKRDILTPIIAYSNTYQNDVAEVLNQFQNIYYCQKNTSIIISIIKENILKKVDFYKKYEPDWKLNLIKVEEYLTKHQKIYSPTLIELQIIKYACEGYSNKEIGIKLNLSRRTIEGYIKKLIVKNNLKNKVQLITYSIENGLDNFNS